MRFRTCLYGFCLLILICQLTNRNLLDEVKNDHLPTAKSRQVGAESRR